MDLKFPHSATPFKGTRLIFPKPEYDPVASHAISTFWTKADFYDRDMLDGRPSVACICDDKYDAMIDSYLLEHNIEFKKCLNRSFFHPDAIVARMVQDPECKEGIMKMVDVKKFDRMWRRCDKFFYLGPDQEVEHQKSFDKFIRTGQKIYAPSAIFTMIDGKPFLTIQDGRHRFANLRGKNMQKVMINFLDEESVRLARRYGILIEEPKVDDVKIQGGVKIAGVRTGGVQVPVGVDEVKVAGGSLRGVEIAGEKLPKKGGAVRIVTDGGKK